MKNLIFYLFFIIFCLFTFNSVSAGQIYTWDITQDFNNYALAKKITLNFKLENPLPSNSFLRIRMPFAIEGTGLMSYYIESDLCTISLDYKLTTISKSTLSLDSSSNTYLIQFYAEYYSQTLTPINQYPLSANTWYRLVIIFANAVSTTTDTILPIEMSTISTNYDNFIVYDSNHDIGNLFYIDPPTATLRVLTSQSYNYNIMTTNNIMITAMPSLSILNQGRFNVILSNEKYIFTSSQTCVISIYQADPNSAVPISNTICELESSSSLFILIPITIIQGWNYQINFQITYPYHIESSQILVYSMYAFTKTVVETPMNTISVTTNAINFDTTLSTVKIGWGVDVKPQSRALFVVYRNGATQDVYNNMRFYFTPVVTIPSTVNGKLIISFGTSATLVQNSFSYVLDTYAGTSITCSQTTNTITCLNVAGFISGTIYSISIRLSIAYDALNPTTLPTDFGLIYYYPMYKGTYTSYSMISSTLTSIVTLTAVNNLDRIYMSTSTDYQGVHTKASISQTLSSVVGYGVKYQGSSTYQTMEFELGIQNTDFSASTLGTSAGLDIYTSNIIAINPSHTYTNADCYSTAGSFSYLTDIGVCSISNGILTSNSVAATNLRIGYNSASFAASAWNSAGAYVSFGFDNIIVNRHSSIYVDDNVLDFYLGFVEKNFESTGIPIYYNKMMINSFTISIPLTFQYVKVVLSNFWTSSAGVGNLAGDSLTAFIRITGSLTATESINTQNFFVFFDYLNGYYDPTTSSAIPRCGISNSGDCSYNPGLNSVGIRYPMLNRYEITTKSTLTSSLNFQFVLPVASIATQKSIYIFVASHNSGVISNIMRYKLTMNPVGLTSWNLINSLGYSSITGANYGINNRSVNMVGNTESILINSYHTDNLNLFNPNDATHYGAAFTYITTYNFINISAIPVFTYTLSGSNPGQLCLYFKYLYSLVYKYVMYCPIYTAMVPNSISSSIFIKNFNLPYTGGISLPSGSLSTYASISNNDGLLLHYEQDISEDVMIPNVLTISANPLVGFLYIGQKDGMIGFSFTITNPLPYQSRIAVLTVDSSPFYMVVSESLNCQINSGLGINIPAYTCSQSFFMNRIEATIILSDSSTVISPSTYTLYFKGVDVNDDPPALQNFYIKTMNYNGFTIDQSISNKMAYSQKDLINNIKMIAVEFDHFNRLARGFVNITFIVGNMSMRVDQYIKFKLEAFSEDNQEASHHYMCQVRYADNDTLAAVFKTCQFNNKFNEIVLYLNYDFNYYNINFKLSLRNIRIPSSLNPYNISLGLYSQDNDPILLSDGYAFPQFIQSNILTYPQLVLFKLYNTLGSSASIIFEVNLQTMTIDTSATIIIKFPYYYTPYLTDKSKIVVLLNQELVEHTFILEYSIKIFDFKSIIPPNQVFNITINGVDIPYFLGNTMNFFLGFYQNGNSSYLTEYGEISDITSYLPNTVGFLNVYNLSISSNFVLETVFYDFLISFTPNITATYKLLTIDFSLDWNGFIYYFPVTCSSKLYTSTGDFTLIPCSFQGLKLVVNLTNNYTADIFYVFRIKIRNPELLDCNLKKFIISLTPNTSVNVSYRAPISLSNIDHLQFYEQTMLLRWKFEIMVNGQYQPITHLTINEGTYSQEIRWSLLDGTRVNQNVYLILQNVYYDEFKLYPKTPIFFVGTNYTFFRIGTPIGTSSILYDLFFLVSQNSFNLIYNRPDTIHLTVLHQRQTVPSPNMLNVSVNIMGVSLPVLIDMSNAPPYVEMNIQTQLDYYPDLGLDFIGSDKFTINVDNPIDSVVLDSLYLVDDSYKETNSFLVLDSFSKNLYDLNSGMFLITLIGDTESITSSDIKIYNNFSSMVVVQANLSNIAYIYFSIKNNDSTLDRSFTEIYNLINNGFTYDFFDSNEENIGVWSYYYANNLENFTINTLRANRSYLLKIWSYNLNGNYSLVKISQFTTLPKNNTFYVRTKLSFNSSINYLQLKMLACYFCSFFKLTVNQIVSVDNFMCDSSSPYINPTFSLPINTVEPNISYFHDSNNNSTYLYFTPYDFIENRDNISVSIATQFSYKDTILYYLNGNIPYKKFLFNTTFVNASTDGIRVNLLTTPSLVSKNDIITPTKAIFEIFLNDNGYIWAVLEKINNIDKNKKNVITTPKENNYATKDQLLMGFNRSNETAIRSDFKFFNNDTGSSSITFTDLEPGTNYGIFYMVSNEGIYKFRKYTDVQWFSISTPFAYLSMLMISLKLLVLVILIEVF